MSCDNPQTAAELATCGVQTTGNRGFGGSGPLSVPELVGNVINVILGLSGLVLVGLFVYGGILYMTAQGDTDRVKTAKKTMINAVIGIVIIVVAYAASSFVISSLIGATSSGTTAGGTPALDSCPPGQIPAQGGGCF